MPLLLSLLHQYKWTLIWRIFLHSIFLCFLLTISSRDTWFVSAIMSKVFKLNTHRMQISSGLIPDGWTEWSPWEDCTGECTFVPTTKFRNRTCLLPVSDSKYPNTDTPMSGCPTNGTETKDCHPYWQRGSVNCPMGQKLSFCFCKSILLCLLRLFYLL